jgi:hypothetical protein
VDVYVKENLWIDTVCMYQYVCVCVLVFVCVSERESWLFLAHKPKPPQRQAHSFALPLLGMIFEILHSFPTPTGF